MHFIAETTPGGGVVAQGLIVILVGYLYLVTPMPESTWRPLGGVLVLLMANWGPVLPGYGEPFAAAVLVATWRWLASDMRPGWPGLPSPN